MAEKKTCLCDWKAQVAAGRVKGLWIEGSYPKVREQAYILVLGLVPHMEEVQQLLVQLEKNSIDFLEAAGMSAVAVVACTAETEVLEAAEVVDVDSGLFVALGIVEPPYIAEVVELAALWLDREHTECSLASGLLAELPRTELGQTLLHSELAQSDLDLCVLAEEQSFEELE